MNFRMKDNNSFSPGMDKATHPSGSGEIEVVVYGIGGMWWIDSVHWSLGSRGISGKCLSFTLLILTGVAGISVWLSWGMDWTWNGYHRFVLTIERARRIRKVVKLFIYSWMRYFAKIYCTGYSSGVTDWCWPRRRGFLRALWSVLVVQLYWSYMHRRVVNCSSRRWVVGEWEE